MSVVVVVTVDVKVVVAAASEKKWIAQCLIISRNKSCMLPYQKECCCLNQLLHVGTLRYFGWSHRRVCHLPHVRGCPHHSCWKMSTHPSWCAHNQWCWGHCSYYKYTKMGKNKCILADFEIKISTIYIYFWAKLQWNSVQLITTKNTSDFMGVIKFACCFRGEADKNLSY